MIIENLSPAAKSLKNIKTQADTLYNLMRELAEVEERLKRTPDPITSRSIAALILEMDAVNTSLDSAFLVKTSVYDSAILV